MTASSATAPRAGMGQPQPRLLYASFELRVASAALDCLVLFIIAALFVTAGAINILISSDFERVTASSTSINVFWAFVVATPITLVLYFFISLAVWGQTVGAAVMGIKVIRSDGRPLSVFGALTRMTSMFVYILPIALGIVGAYALRESPVPAASALGASLVVAVAGVLWAAIDQHRRTLHDRIAGTIVVQST